MKIWQSFGGALVAAAIVAAVVVATGSATGGGNAARIQTLTLIEAEQSGSFSFVDNDPKSTSGNPENPDLSGGDIFAFSSELLTKTKQHAGFLHAFCVATVPSSNGFEDARFQCSGTMNLQGGTLALSGLVNTRREVSQIAIVGGTGSYEGVTGSIRSVSRDNESSVDMIRLHR